MGIQMANQDEFRLLDNELQSVEPLVAFAAALNKIDDVIAGVISAQDMSVNRFRFDSKDVEASLLRAENAMRKYSVDPDEASRLSVALTVMHLTEMNMTSRDLGRVHLALFNVSLKAGNHYRYTRIVEQFTRPESISGSTHDDIGKYGAVAAEINKLADERVQMIMTPVTALTELMVNRPDFMKKQSPVINKAIQKQSDSLRRQYASSYKYLQQKVTEAISLMQASSQEQEKKLEFIKKKYSDENRKLRTQIRNLQSMKTTEEGTSKVLSDFFGGNVSLHSDTEVDELEQRNQELQLQNDDLIATVRRLKTRLNRLENKAGANS